MLYLHSAAVVNEHPLTISAVLKSVFVKKRKYSENVRAVVDDDDISVLWRRGFKFPPVSKLGRDRVGKR
jgi:hypothetical protein